MPTPTTTPVATPAQHGSIIDQGIGWLTTYASEINAIVSIFLTMGIIVIYLLQHSELSEQTSAMKSQTESMRAGIRPVLKIVNFRPLDSNPVSKRDISHADYIELEIENVGNEVAVDLELEYYTLLTPELESGNVIQPVVSPLDPVSRPIVVREGVGGILGAGDTETFFAPVEFDIQHDETSSGSSRLPSVFRALDRLGVESVCLALVIKYRNLADETTRLPIEKGIKFSLDEPYSSFKEAFENRDGTCEIRGFVPEDVREQLRGAN